jgi:hypothetical protein
MWVTAGARDAARDAAVEYGGWGWRVAAAHYTLLPGRHRRRGGAGRRRAAAEVPGLVPVRCSCGQRGCTAPGRHPVRGDWLRSAATDPVTVGCWWYGARPWNVALVAGEAFDVWTVPIAVARSALAAAEAAGNPIGPVAYGIGGWHFYTRAVPAGQPAPQVGGWGIGHSGRGCCLLAPPSQAAGSRLRWWRPPFGPGRPALPPWEPVLDALLVAVEASPCLARTE